MPAIIEYNEDFMCAISAIEQSKCSLLSTSHAVHDGPSSPLLLISTLVVLMDFILHSRTDVISMCALIIIPRVTYILTFPLRLYVNERMVTCQSSDDSAEVAHIHYKTLGELPHY